MRFYPEQLFHIYNQGNNQKVIFYNEENYDFFLWKMRAYLLPFGELISYCLMPNHYHWQFYVKRVEIDRLTFRKHADEVEYNRRVMKYGVKAKPVDSTMNRKAKEDSKIDLNESIGILQRTYSRAINRQNDWSGSLFRKEFKSKDGWIDEFVTVYKLNGKLNDKFFPGSDYAYRCLSYIHDNPLKAGLVKINTEWRYSSASDYAGLKKDSLCNLDLGREIIDFM